MAGHSKWSNIKHRKWAQDAKRSKLFTRLLREVAVAARLGDSEPVTNPRLRNAIDDALANNVPKDRIERAIQRGAGGTEGQDLEEVRYEGYGPGGVAVMVDCMTDNRNRTAGDVRYVFSKNDGKLGIDGCVAFMFSKCGYLSFSASADKEALMEAAIEAGAEDMVTCRDGSIEIYTSPDDFQEVKHALKQQGYEAEDARITMLPSNYTYLDDEQAYKILRLFDQLENLADVQHVYSNADIDEELLTRFANESN